MATRFVDDADPGCTLAGPWSGAGGGYAGGLRYIGAGSGSNSAKWTRGCVAGQSVTAYLTWVADPNRGTNVPWSVLDSDGTTVLASGTVNQQNAPSGATDAGFGWTLLGTVTPSGATVSVKITDNANGYVIADAVRLASASWPDIASAQAGNWGSTSTWNDGIVPSASQTVTVGHAVTVAASASFGNSPAAGTTMLTVTPAGTLTVAGGVTFTAKADCLNSGTIQVGDGTGGGVWEWDASAASSPSATVYKVLQNSATATFRLRGASGNRAVLRSNVGGANGTLTPASNDAGIYDWQWFQFLRVGDASNDVAWASLADAGSATTVLSASDGLFTACGRVNTATTMGAHQGFSFARCSWSGSVGSAPVRLATAAPAAGVTRTLSQCHFVAAPVIPCTGETVDECVFENGYDTASTSSTWAVFRRNLLRLTAAGAAQISGASTYGDVTDCFLLADNQNGNPHILLPTSSCTVHGVIFQYTGPQLVDGGDGVYFGSALTVTVEYCLCLPSSGDGLLSCNLLNANSGASVTSRHNTYFSGGQGGHCIGDLSQSVGIYGTIKSNLGWVGNGFSGGALGPLHVYSAHNSSSPTSDTLDVVTPAGCDFNAGWNLLTGYSRATQWPGVSGKGYVTNTSAAVGTHDVDLGTGGTGPGFMDSTRNVGNWAVAMGQASAGATNAAKVAAALSYVAADPTRIYSGGSNALIPWVRAGFAPTNPAIATAAHDGTTIGAVPFASAAPRSNVLGPGFVGSGDGFRTANGFSPVGCAFIKGV